MTLWRAVPVVLLVCSMRAGVGQADAGVSIALPDVISNGMVLQSGRTVPIWGVAGPGAGVSVRFGGEDARTQAGPDGKWKAYLGPLDVSSTPRAMTLRCPDDTITIEGVLVGEVWIAGGQSNMWYPLMLMSNREDHRLDADRLRNVKVFRALIPDQPDRWDKVDYERALGVSAVAYFFMRDLSAAYPGVPIGVIDTSVAATWAEGWMSKGALQAYNAAPDHPEKIVMDGSGYAEVPEFQPSYWYEAIMANVMPYGARGVIWYQGEGNTPKPEQHKSLLPALIENWRQDFEQPELVFLLCQLPPHHFRIPWDPQDELWAYFRESQLHVWQNVRGTSMVVAPECGAAGNVHPRHKDEFGERLALAARAVAYGEKIVYSGPVYRSKRVSEDGITIHFDHVGSGLMARGGEAELRQFEICGPDGRFAPARARIVGDTVVVFSPAVTRPVHVRYAWSNYPADIAALDKAVAALEEDMGDHPEPGKWFTEQMEELYSENADYPVEADLYNQEGLPASPFRTDDFQFPTQ